ncbi:hypothetical protein M2401_004993 [Pseudomonas sp. JUb42]|uniref:hypothetical protein n=1 Tax=Pseudomonas sp. JUb42 TaxID=2940611 RepID=UPI0021685E05|nr:hypothetical protein [Pseudomonas sp. JUb42]MCS3471231.1 hypothetical protein [Pseudomonas sp. JUb42]
MKAKTAKLIKIAGIAVGCGVITLAGQAVLHKVGVLHDAIVSPQSHSADAVVLHWPEQKIELPPLEVLPIGTAELRASADQ